MFVVVLVLATILWSLNYTFLTSLTVKLRNFVTHFNFEFVPNRSNFTQVHKSDCFWYTDNKFKSMININQIKTWSQYVTDNNLTNQIPPSTFAVDDEINSKISLWMGDITHLNVDAIVNAANKELRAGSGICGAIHKAAGHSLRNECASLNGCDPGSAKVTRGHNLQVKGIIHAVGPKGKQPVVLKSAYNACLNLMLTQNFKSMAVPCISTGIYGYPPNDAVHVAASTVREFLEVHKSKVDRIIFTVFSEQDKKIYERALPTYFPTNFGSSSHFGPMRSRASSNRFSPTSLLAASSRLLPTNPAAVDRRPSTYSRLLDPNGNYRMCLCDNPQKYRMCNCNKSPRR